MTEIDDKIKELENDWHKYHKNPRDNRMPDMMLLTKLRIEQKKQITKDRWEV